MSKHALELESALDEASIFSEIIAQWMATSIGFENTGPLTLGERECTQVYWAINEIARMTKEAFETYHKPEVSLDA